MIEAAQRAQSSLAEQLEEITKERHKLEQREAQLASVRKLAIMLTALYKRSVCVCVYILFRNGFPLPVSIENFKKASTLSLNPFIVIPTQF